ncbi:6-hydroxymethylpterin diphosphokinase MptE-like protein [Aeromonas caviae]|uniref:motility associated factor glycosyltransferase family protein n=1 Tax=Aeromonas caviae TaxID=648 RepID=UPI0029D8F3BE|nr:6-hydroxymethylpterin diphosphokinase MptE-like protein [Aeromonas caviae]MDX7828227.1 6-hydroxymethylpterin diphosphokinase MptE-like protein [Aeromonas caviae]
MDFESKINSLEVELGRLRAQKEQEQAMQEVLPARFEMNMAAFLHYIPDIYEKFKTYNPVRGFSFFCGENGIPNLLWNDSKLPFYGDDPYKECEDQIGAVLNSPGSIQTIEFSKEDNPIDFIHVDYMNKMMKVRDIASEKLMPISKVGTDIPLMLMYGVGLGYQLSYLYEQCRPRILFVIEPNFDLFYASLFTFDWYKLLEHLNGEGLGIHIFLGQNKDEVIQDITVASAKVGSYLSAASVGFWHYKSDEIIELITRTKQEFFFLISGWGFFDDNVIALSHCVENIRKNIPFLVKGKSLDDKWREIPVFVIGNGPSLDIAIDKLKSCQHQVIILSCGSALSSLYKAGIKPDIHVQVERTKVVPDSHFLLKDDQYLKGILFLSVDVIHPDCAEQFDRVGLAFKSFEPGFPLIKMHSSIARTRDILSSANPLVGNTGLATACRLGFRNIYLLGIDNGYKSNAHHHSKFSFYFDDTGNQKDKLSIQVNKKSNHLVPGNFGGEVETTNMMISSRTVMENLIGAYTDVHFYNCSDGAKIKGAEPKKISDISFENFHLDKDSLLNHIINDIYQPMDIDIDKLKENFHIELFNDFIDMFIRDWDKYFSTREDIVSNMLKVRDYLLAMRVNGYEHIYRCLIGSINYSFSVILSTLYRFDVCDYLYKTINDIIKIMVEYFVAIKNKYVHALSSVDRKEHGLFD